MALRVLLADESSTIKRVMQLALQDFAVEVKSVHAGVDVLEVTKSFKPDIVFADVLLQKKNGYEVSGELKGNSETKNIPVVLMWSSFMELDQAAYKKCGADGKLEKPFDVETLRRLVKDNVTRLRGESISDFLQFPENVATPLRTEENLKKQTSGKKSEAIITPPPPIITPPPLTSSEAPTNPSLATLPPLPDEDDSSPFQVSNLTAAKGELPPPQLPPIPSDSEQEDWVKQDISKFTLDLTPIKLEGEDAAISFDVQHGSIDGEKQLTSTSPHPYFSNEPTNTAFNLKSPPPERTKVDDIPFPDFDNLQSTDAHLPIMPEIDFVPEPFDSPQPSTQSNTSINFDRKLSADELEKIIRAQSKEVIEQVVRKVVPEIATKLIKEEINRLMSEGS